MGSKGCVPVERLDLALLVNTQHEGRACEARASGRFDREIVPIVVGVNGDDRVISQDQGIRPDTTAESLAALEPVFKPGGILHAGNSSQITDGAAAVLLMSLERANALGGSPGEFAKHAIGVSSELRRGHTRRQLKVRKELVRLALNSGHSFRSGRLATHRAAGDTFPRTGAV